ncbi:MAG TPA: CocE/NonD family hydrolase [Desulfomonilia bacterium]
MIKSLIRVLLAVVLFIVGFQTGFASEEEAQKPAGTALQDISGKRVSEPFKYSGYGAPKFKGVSKETTFVAMSDGTKLAVDIFLPKDGPKTDKFPAIFIFTPYGRSYLYPQMTWYEKVIARITKGTSGPVFDYSLKYDTKLFLSHGYAIVVADMRGTGASYGSQIPFTPVLAEDGKEMVDWIGSQPWSNGKVGMTGQSYLGWIQLMIAAKHPKALTCIMPEMILADGFTEGIRPGGIDAIAWIERYSEFLQNLNLNRFDPGKMSLPTTPAKDEDNDGSCADEMPLMKDGSFLDNGVPVYSDGRKRQDIYFNATKEHTSDIPFNFFARKNTPYFDSTAPEIIGNARFVDSSPDFYINEIIASGIPVYNVGGWFDGFTKGTTKLYATMEGKTAARMNIAPRFHYHPFITKQYKKYFGYEEDYTKQIAAERLRFFDFYLKGIQNGIASEPPVNIYVMNYGWRTEREWPLKRQKVTPFYFNSQNGLSQKPSNEGADTYMADFTHSSSYGKNNKNRWLMMYTPDGLMDRTAPDKKCLVYETEILVGDIEVTGHPVVDIWVSSSRDDGDFYVYLTDVDESGRSLYVTEGELRAGWKNEYNDDDQVLGKTDIKPDLPWHGYRKDQYTEKPFADGKTVELRFDLMPTSWVFKKGHRIRIAIACADYRNFEMNPYLCSGNEPGDCPETLVSIKHTKEYPSRIELPVIPSAQ